MRTSRLDLSPGLYLTVASMLLIVPLKWCAALLFAALFHEFCHLAAVRICGGHIPLIRAGTGGAMIQAASLSPGKALVCTLAGPLGGLLLLLLSRWFPRLAICAAMQSAFNLLPVNNLDGGHALRYCAFMLFPSSVAARICRVIQLLVLVFSTLLGLYGTFFLKLGLLPLLAAVILILKGKG